MSIMKDPSMLQTTHLTSILSFSLETPAQIKVIVSVLNTQALPIRIMSFRFRDSAMGLEDLRTQ